MTGTNSMLRPKTQKLAKNSTKNAKTAKILFCRQKFSNFSIGYKSELFPLKI
jgi:hypothetical protein